MTFGRPTEKQSALQYIQEVVLRHTDDACLIWPYRKDKAGYGRFGTGSKVVSRLVCEWVHGKAPKDKPDAAHSCGNRACVAPAHLRWATRKENMADVSLYRPREPMSRFSLWLRDDQIRWLAGQAEAYGTTTGAILRHIVEEVRS